MPIERRVLEAGEPVNQGSESSRREQNLRILSPR